MNPVIRVKLFNALTEYDRRQSRSKSYNPYALGHYAKALQETESDVQDGAAIRQALLGNFNGRLLDTLLVAIGEPKFTREEMHAQR